LTKGGKSDKVLLVCRRAGPRARAERRKPSTERGAPDAGEVVSAGHERIKHSLGKRLMFLEAMP
jgi:hypothetical protein